MKFKQLAAGLLAAAVVAVAAAGLAPGMLAAPAEAPAEGLLLYSSFDNGDGADDSGSGNDGTVAGTLAFADGVRGKSVEITGQTVAGSDDSAGDRYIDYGTGLSQALATGDFSVSLWYQSTGASSNAALLSNKNFKSGSNTGWAMGCFANDLRFNLTASGKSRSDVQTTGSGPLFDAKDGAWHHLGVTVDRDGSMSYYVDGALVKSVSIASTAGITVDAGLPVVLGAGGNKCNAVDNCRMDELRVYGRSLSADEVSALYELDKPAEDVDLADGLLLFADFNADSVSGSTVQNRAGGDYSGTVNGSGVSFVESTIGGNAVQVVNRDAATGSANDDATADSYVDFGTALSERLGSESWSMSFWYQAVPGSDGLNSWGALLSNKNYRSGANRGFAVGYYGADSKMNYATGSKSEIKGIDLSGGGWHHFAATFAAGNSMSVYLDGEKVSSTSLSAGTIHADLPFILGAGGNLNNPITNLQMDDLRVYGRALSAAAVQALYAEHSAVVEQQAKVAQLQAKLDTVSALAAGARYTQEAIDTMRAALEDAIGKAAALSGEELDALIGEVQTEYDDFIKGAKPLASFHLISDVHISTADSAAGTAYRTALQNMAGLNADTNIAFINTGDFTNNSGAAEYDAFYSITEAENSVPKDKTIILMGNHDVRGPAGANQANWNRDPTQPEKCVYWDTAEALYRQYNADYMPDTGTLYHKKVLGGYTFLVINTELGLKDAVYMSDEQVAWLEASLKECYEADPDKPVFIACHNALNNTLWRSNTLDGFDGIDNTAGPYGAKKPYSPDNDEKVKEILAKYPVGIWMSGHIHNGLGTDEAVARPFGICVDLPSFNDSENGYADRGVGFEVAIYADEVVFCGYNFLTGEYLPQYDISVKTPTVSAAYQQALAKDSGYYTEETRAELEAALAEAESLLTMQYDQQALAWNTTTPPAQFLYHADTWAKLDAVQERLKAAVANLEEGSFGPSDPSQKKPESPEFKALRQKWTEYLLGGDGTDLDMNNDAVITYVANLNQKANNYYSSMAKSDEAGRTNLWADLNMTPINDYSSAAYTRSGNMATAMTRLQDIALAWATKGCDLYQDEAALDELLLALDHMCANYFKATGRGYGNWYHWEITAPTALMNATMVLYDQLSQARLDAYTASAQHYVPYCNKGGPNSNGPAMTGGNLLLKANGVAQCGILDQDASMLENVKTSVEGTLSYNDYSQFYTKDADGFYADGSYIQHQALAYIGGYGADLYNNLGVFLSVLSGSDWQIADAQNVGYDFVFTGIEPFIYEGHTMDMVASRDVTRNGHTDHTRTASLLQAILPLRGNFPTAEQNARFDSMVKYLLQQDADFYFGRMSSITSIMKGLDLLADDSVAPRTDYTLTKTFAMDKTVHITPDFAFALSMHSARTYGHELINSEGKRTWNTSDGMYYLYDADLDKYGEGYWATVDPTRLPGTTAEHIVFNNGMGDRTKNIYDWTGGTSLGNNGVAGTHMRTLGQVNSSTRNGTDVKKSWFMFGDRIIAVGSGITSTTGNTVETIIDNAKLKADGSNVITVDGAAANLTADPTALTPTWMHLEGNVAGTGTGYWFPQPQTVTAIRETRTGDWSAQGTTTGTATNTFATFWFDHGQKPADAQYAYVLLPGKTAAETAAWAAAPDVEILESGNDIHSARDNAANLTAANFWQAGTSTATGLTVSAPASVMTRRDGDTLEVSLSDPTQKAATVELTLPVSGEVSAQDANVTVLATEPFVKLSFNTAGLGGQSSFATVKVNEAADKEIVAVTETPDPVQVDQGTYFKDLPLPKTVAVLANDMQTYEVEVEWDRTAYNRLTPGTYRLTGKLLPPEGLANTAGCTVAIDVTVGTTTAPLQADVHVNGGSHADQNYEGAGSMPIKNDTDPSYDRKVLLRADLSAVPQDAGNVWLNLTTGGPDTGFTAASLYRVEDDWDPAAVTWNTMPARVGDAPVAGFTAADAAAGQVTRIDITEAVRAAQAEGKTVLSLEIEVDGTAGSKNQMNISALENADPAARPFLSWSVELVQEMVDKTNLQMLVDTAKGLDPALFSNYDAQRMDAALAVGEAVLADDTADMGDVYDAEDQMADALLRLRLIPEKWQDTTQ